MRHVAQRVDDKAVVTDDSRLYERLPHRHDTVNHTEGVYVSGDVHTQTIEGFWSLVKRGISGTHTPSPRSGYRDISTNASGGTTTF